MTITITVLREIVYFVYFVSLHALSPIWSPRLLERYSPPVMEFVKMLDHAFSDRSPHCCRCQSNSWGLLGNHLTALDLWATFGWTRTFEMKPKTATKQVTRHMSAGVACSYQLKQENHRSITSSQSAPDSLRRALKLVPKNDTSTPSTPSTPSTHPDNHCMTISACMKAVGGQNWAQPARARSRSLTPQRSLQRH